MQEGDLDGVVAVAAVAFPDHFEDRACFAERLALFAQGCFVLTADAQVQGYLIAYPWLLGSIPSLNGLLHQLPDARDALYLHDLALLPAVCGKGHTRPIVERLVDEARQSGVRAIALVSVNGTVPFWQGLGFLPVTDDPVITAKLATYGPDAAYMQRQI